MIIELNTTEEQLVGGGNPAPGQSWQEYLEETYPLGEWDGSSFLPNGKGWIVP